MLLFFACAGPETAPVDPGPTLPAADDTAAPFESVPVDAAPGVAFLDPRPGEVFTPEQDVRVEILAGDDDALEALSLSWGGDVGGVELPAAPGPDGLASFEIPALPLGEYVVQVVVSDPAGLTAAAEVAFSVVVLDADGDGFVNAELRGDDCDDGDAAVNPDATEVCDTIDNDCDDRVDEGVTDRFYGDTDGDGFGDPTMTVYACAAPAGFVVDATDCDDTSAARFPANPEVCDHLDNDCDFEVDEAVLLPFYRDIDGDGYGDESDVAWDCDAPSGYVEPGGDCDDTEAATSPAETEICLDGIDNDCDGTSNSCGLGGTVDLGIADAKIRGEAEDDGAGGSVSTAGDYNGDGLSDLILGAPGTSGGGAGGAYVFFGPVAGTLGVSAADVSLLGAAAGDGAGYSVATAGDYDGDGFDDVFVGAWSNDDGGVDAGAAYLVRGPTTGTLDLGSADLLLVGESAGDQAGLSVAVAGDVDGDGQSDVLVGGWGSDAGGAYSGAAWLVNGPRFGTVDLGAADATFIGEASGDFAGQAVSGAGDLDSDGYDDLIVGAPGTASGMGTAYVVLGPVSGDLDLSAADATIVGDVADDATGGALAAMGDVDGDGVSDVMVGAIGYDYGGFDTGGAFLFFGPVTGSVAVSAADVVLVGERAGDNAGWSVGGAGDMDGDGQDDMLVGAAREDSGGSAAGAAYLVYGPGASLYDLGGADARMLGEATDDYAGVSVAGAGDTDGDGKFDILVGAPREDTAVPSGAGAVYLVLGTGL